MNRKIKTTIAGIAAASMIFTMTGCFEAASNQKDSTKQIEVGNVLATNQPTPTDIAYSLERYNLIRRAYWVNGQREKAKNYPCPIADIPLGYVVLLTDNGAVVGNFIVEGKVTSLNSYLSPDSEFYEQSDSVSTRYGNSYHNEWLADVDGSYGYNQDGIFFFTPDGKYIEWTGTYLYSDIPFIVEDPVLKTEGINK